MIDRFYKQLVTIKRQTLIDDGGGSKEATWSKWKTIKGLIVLSSGNERRVNEKKTVISSHTLFCSKIDIKATDRVEYSGKIYEVILPEDPLALGHHMEVDLQLIQ